MLNTKKFDIPADVRYIITTLNQHHYEAYIVGGCVRDMLLNLVPKDWDITTNAKPDEIKAIFDKTVDTGIKYGTVTVLINQQGYEVTTYRVDGKYLLSRRPESVVFTASLEEDLSRRDFTVNAMAYHPQIGLSDPFEGGQDLKQRVIRCVGNPDLRFQEDALRMLRAVRFSAQLDFDIDYNTLEAIKSQSYLIAQISGERIRDELTKILMSDQPLKFIQLYETGLLPLILPEFIPCMTTSQKNPYHVYPVGLHILHAVKHVEKNSLLRWTMLLHDTGKPKALSTDEKGIDHFYGHQAISAHLAKEILKRLKFDNKSIEIIYRLIKEHDRPIQETDKAVRRAVSAVGNDIFLDLLKVKEADIKAQNPIYLSKRIEMLNHIKEIYLHLIESGTCFSVKDLAVDGNDIINLGVKKGKHIGVILNKLLDIVVDEPELNTYDILIQKALELRRNTSLDYPSKIE